MTRAANCNEPRRKKACDLPPGSKLAYTVDEAGSAMGVSRTTVFDMIRNGEVIAKKLRGRTIITRDELQRVIDEAPPARAA
ncbi:helix-turn-helix domain-containing protein [Brevundimonas sp. SGAir0440]|uniref:helix-turn-helix domain-containing protein n=1 Tax=Brevundimonas sp. SGAir0440 TaxID=2579977 RepID=UPI0010CCC4FD|nr:helix-turn-helix domain-containing protein [Brevundimonas sp. SGAir0440]QCQ97786.1 DNA-binding protein [Brevundimonas sp. SGAir0440]